MSKMEQLAQWIQESRHIVFFGGAGVSCESGIPDFRSKDGLYHQHYRYPPETILSHRFYVKHPEEFFDFYRERMLYLEAQPNDAHKKLAQWEQQGKLDAVITQNIDGLHQAAGSRKVLELHGSVHRNYCASCGAFYDAAYLQQSTGIPRCTCGGRIKPDVVLYEESLDDRILKESALRIQGSDMLIIGGTSLAVYPAAGLIHCYQGSRLVLINKSPTPQDKAADLLIQGSIGKSSANCLNALATAVSKWAISMPTKIP